jgi:hypothetical protein
MNGRKVKDADAWLSGLTECQGFWWLGRNDWLSRKGDKKQVQVRQPSHWLLKSLANAPESISKRIPSNYRTINQNICEAYSCSIQINTRHLPWLNTSVTIGNRCFSLAINAWLQLTCRDDAL